MAYIKLSREERTLVDDDDFEYLSQWKWYCNSSGYAARNIDTEKSERATLLMHRLIINAPADMQVDHINGDKLDNRRSNLRVCTKQENVWNRKLSAGRKYAGVYYSSRLKAYNSYISIINRRTYLGTFKTEVEAAMAYNTAALEHRGEFARLNEV